MKPITIQAHESVINVVKFNLDGDLFFSAGNDKNVNVYSGIDFERLGSCGCSSAAKTIAISEDSQYLFVGTGSGTVEVFEIKNGNKLGTYEIEDSRIRHIDLSYGGKNLLVVYTNYSNVGFAQFLTVKDLLDHIKTPNPRFKGVTLELPASFSQISYGLCNRYLIGVTEKGALYKFNLKGGVEAEKKIFDEGVGITFSRDYAVVAVSGNLGVKLFDPDTLQELKFYKQDFPQRGVAISPLYNLAKDPRQHIVMGGGTPAREAALLKAGGTQIHIVNMVSSDALAHIPGHFSPINSLVWFRDGGGIISGAEEGRIFVFRFDKTYWEEPQFK